jgi:hypothetical protein
MTTHITKTWFDGKNIVTQEIPVEEVYKREWVGLTDEEIEDVFFDMGQYAKVDLKVFATAIEAYLKEKNT